MERNVCRCEGPDLAKDEVKHLKSEGKTVLIQKGFEDVVLTSYIGVGMFKKSYI